MTSGRYPGETFESICKNWNWKPGAGMLRVYEVNQLLDQLEDADIRAREKAAAKAARQNRNPY